MSAGERRASPTRRDWRLRLRRPRRGGWACAAVVLVAIGSLAAVLAAGSIAHSAYSSQRITSRFGAGQVASTLRLAIQHEEDLVVSGRAFVAGNPGDAASAFARWARSVAALQRYPELADVGLLVRVSHARLAGFERAMLAHPILPASRQPSGSRGSFEVLPPGKRAYYCLAVAGLVRAQVTVLPPGLDYCAVEPSLAGAIASGQSSYVPFTEGARTMLGVQTPIYVGGVVPTTRAERQRTFLGWLAESIAPRVLLRTALDGHPHTAVSFRYRPGGANVSFAAGKRPARAQTSTVDLHNGWIVQTYAAMPSDSIFAHAQALTLLIGGCALSLLLGALTFVLGTGRTRAMSLVDEKTRELSYQALHDGLTGLPNRVLVIKRAEEMLARDGLVTAALYIDLDGFKQVNDRFGHAAGDKLLCVLGARLRGAVRAQDIVGRLGGDEFVVLLESLDDESRPDLVAERLITISREPVTLGGGQQVTVSASVGIAVGPRSSVDLLLRDADLALYAAKDAGKDRYILFEPNASLEQMKSLSHGAGGEAQQAHGEGREDRPVGERPGHRRRDDVPVV
jgi:diguanylate cyclase (GGDEF)-like protein